MRGGEGEEGKGTIIKGEGRGRDRKSSSPERTGLNGHGSGEC